jgi:spermidine/putrescine transport system permease protein
MKKKGIGGALYIALILLLMYLPMIVVVLYSFNASTSRSSYAFTGFSLKNYTALFNDTRGLLPALGTSLRLAVYSCGLSLVIGTLGAVGMVRRKFRLMGALENLSTLPIMVPEIILGMAFMSLFSFLGLQSGMLTLVIAHTTFCIPYIYIIVKGRLSEMDVSLLEAARDLGANPRRVFFDITLPLITPAVLSGTMLAFAMSMDDFVISFFVTSTTTTLPLRIYSSVKIGVPLTINAISTLMLAVVFLAVGLRTLVLPKKRKLS